MKPIGAILKTAFGTDIECRLLGMDRKKVNGEHEGISLHDKIVEADSNIDSMNAATKRLARFKPAANLVEALKQITED